MSSSQRRADRNKSLTMRQRMIVELARQRGFVPIDTLAMEFSITPQTARRDVNMLCDSGLLHRYHGGAGLPPTVENMAYEDRQALNLEGKRRIARLVAHEIPDHASLFITLGTTTREAARALTEHQGLCVITNHLQVAGMLAGNQGFEVIVAGGSVRPLDAGVTGEAALEFFRNFKTDYALISISGIEMDGTLYDFDQREMRLLKVAMANARHVFLLSDHTKYDRHALVRLGQVADSIDALFTDRAPPEPLAEVLEQAGVRVVVADT